MSADWIKDEYNTITSPSSFYFFAWNVFNANSAAVANAQTNALAFGSNNTAGNGLVVWGVGYNPASSGVSNTPTDSAGNTYAACSINNQAYTAAYANTSLWYVSNAKAGANTVTWHMAAAGQYWVWGIAEVAVPGGVGMTCDQAVFNTGTGGAPTVSATTGTLSSSSEAVVGIATAAVSGNDSLCATPYTAGSGFQLLASQCNSTTHVSSAGVEWSAVGSTSAVTCPVMGAAYGASPSSMFCATFYSNSTPTAATPTFPTSTDSGVTVSTTTPSSTLYYCQSASTCTPSISSQVYSSSFAPIFPEVCAIATATGYNNSAVACVAVTAVAPSFSTQPTVLYSSPSSISSTFTTTNPASIKGECGTTSGGPYNVEVTPEVYTEGWQRTSFTGTTTAWGTAFAITGLHQATLYYCVIVAYDVTHADNTQSSQFSATTTTLSTTPVTVGAISQLTRLNDQYNGANGMPNNGFWMNGDTETETWADDGNYYGHCHDCNGVGGAYSNSVGLVTWNAAHTTATQPVGVTGFGVSGSGAWQTWGIQSVRGQLYLPIVANAGAG